MGFWQGVNEGLTFVMEADTRKKEIEQARKDRLAERQSDAEIRRQELEQARKYSLEDRDAANKDKIRELMIGYGLERTKEEKAAEGLKLEAAKLFQLFPDESNDKLEFLKSDPKAAAEAYSIVSDIMTKAAAGGAPITPDVALGFVYVNQYGEAKSVAPDLDIANYPATWEGLSSYREATLTPSGPTTIVSANPQAYLKPNTENMGVVRGAFERAVQAKAIADLPTLAGNATEESKLRASIEDFKNPNSEGYREIMKKYGQPIFNTFASKGDDFSAAILQDPNFTEFSTKRFGDIQLANQILNDPESSEDDKVGARELLNQAYGGNYGG